MKKFIFVLFLFNNFILHAQHQTDIYFGGDVGVNFGIQDINKTYESILEKSSGSDLTIERIPNFIFSLYAGYYGFAENIAFQIGIDFNINEQLNQTIYGINDYSYLSYYYINTPFQLRISRKIFGPIQIGLLFGPYISWPVSRINEETMNGTNSHNQEVTVGISVDQIITYSLKYGNIVFGIKYRRDFNEKLMFSIDGINLGLFIEQNLKIVIGYEYHIKI
ncbi:MAG: hypothetical protein LBS57_04130 [Treponema sp.]|nr:hypothetical protein [Treponema sp.]